MNKVKPRIRKIKDTAIGPKLSLPANTLLKEPTKPKPPATKPKPTVSLVTPKVVKAKAKPLTKKEEPAVEPVPDRFAKFK